MSKGQQVKLGDYCEITSSKRIFYSDYVADGVPFFRSKEIIERQNGSDISEPLFISTEKYESIKSQFGIPLVGDMLLTSVGTIGIAYIVKPDDYFYFKDGNLTWFRNFSPLLSSKYLYYWITSQKGKGILYNSTIGSSQKALTISALKKLVIPLPPIEVQRKIADVLSAYDDLIENNRKQIKLLEEAAQRLYKEWFIDLRFPGHETTPITNGIPEGWERKPISAIAEYLNGFAFKPSDWQKEGKPIIKIKEMNQGISDDTPRNNGDCIPAKYLIKAGDILFSWSATLSVMIWNQEDGWLNQHLFKVTPAAGISREFVLQAISNTLSEFQNLTTGATMKHIQRGKLDEVFVNVPKSTVMNMFFSHTEPIRNKILTLSSKIKNAMETRDRLLPKLMTYGLEVNR